MSRYLAIDPDASGLTVAVGRLRGSTVTLETVFAHLPDEPSPLTPQNALALGVKLKGLLKDARVPAAPVLLSVGRDKLILKEVKHPPTAPQDEPAVVRFQAIRDLTESPDDLTLDYVPIPGDFSGERKALVAFVRNDWLSAAKTLCETAGLKLAAVTPRPFAAAAADRRAAGYGSVPAPEATEPVAVVTLSPTGGEFVVVQNGTVRFSRTIPPHVMGSEPTLVGELRRNLTVYSGQFGSDVTAVHLAEADAGQGAWAGRIAAALPVPVYPFDPLEGSVAADAVPARLRGRFLSVVGLLAGKSNDLPTLNFLLPRQPKADIDPNRNRAAAAVLVGIVLAAGLALGGYLLVSQATAKTFALRQQVTSLDTQLANLEPDLKRLAAADEFDRLQVNWLDELYDLADRYPDISKLKLLQFLGDLNPPPTAKDRLAQASKPPKPKNAPPEAVAKLKLTVATDNLRLASDLVSYLEADRRAYIGPMKTGGQAASTAGSKSNVSLYIIDTGLAHRAPEEYTRRLKATLPKAPDPTPAPPAVTFGGP